MELRVNGYIEIAKQKTFLRYRLTTYSICQCDLSGDSIYILIITTGTLRAKLSQSEDPHVTACSLTAHRPDFAAFLIKDMIFIGWWVSLN